MPEPAQKATETARDSHELIGIYVADALDGIDTAQRILDGSSLVCASSLTNVLGGARALLEAARQVVAEEADSA